MKTPLISVIVPNYNYSIYLPLRIDSILKQSFEDFELILLDDASTDDSVEVLRRYAEKDKRIVCVIVNECNSGSPFIQWYKGLEQAKGKYIWIAEGDDFAEPLFLERTVSLLERYPNAAYCFTGSYGVDENGCRTGLDMDRWNKKQLNNPHKFAVFQGDNYLKYNQLWKNYVYNASGVVFRKEAYSKVTNVRWQSMRYCGDWMFWSLLALQGDVIEVYERLNYFRRHSKSVTLAATRAGEHFVKSMYECMEITDWIMQASNVSFYIRCVCYGGFYKFIKRNMTDKQLRKELEVALNKYCHSIKFVYAVERVNKFFAGLFPSLDKMRSERCC